MFTLQCNQVCGCVCVHARITKLQQMVPVLSGQKHKEIGGQRGWAPSTPCTPGPGDTTLSGQDTVQASLGLKDW